MRLATEQVMRAGLLVCTVGLAALLAAAPWSGGPAPALAAAVVLTPAQEASLAEVREMLDEVVRIYSTSKVHVSVASWVGSGEVSTFSRTSIVYTSGGWLFVHPRLLDSPARDLFVAVSVAYHIVGLGPLSSGASADEYQRARERRAMDANAKAVEVLMRAKGLSEETAVRAMYAWLLQLHRAHRSGQFTPPRGRASPCEEIADLLARFARHREWPGLVECVPS